MVKAVVGLARFIRVRNTFVRKWVGRNRVVGDIQVIYGFRGECCVFVGRSNLKTGRVKKMHEAIYLIDPVIELWIILRVIVVISWLPRASREAVGSVLCTWNMDESKVKEKDRDDPTVDACRWCDIRVG